MSGSAVVITKTNFATRLGDIKFFPPWQVFSKKYHASVGVFFHQPKEL
jgi:hypothetical protein